MICVSECWFIGQFAALEKSGSGAEAWQIIAISTPLSTRTDAGWQKIISTRRPYVSMLKKLCVSIIARRLICRPRRIELSGLIAVLSHKRPNRDVFTAIFVRTVLDGKRSSPDNIHRCFKSCVYRPRREMRNGLLTSFLVWTRHFIRKIPKSWYLHHYRFTLTLHGKSLSLGTIYWCSKNGVYPSGRIVVEKLDVLPGFRSSWWWVAGEYPKSGYLHSYRFKLKLCGINGVCRSNHILYLGA